jgi:hypothetical protein
MEGLLQQKFKQRAFSAKELLFSPPHSTVDRSRQKVQILQLARAVSASIVVSPEPRRSHETVPTADRGFDWGTAK